MLKSYGIKRLLSVSAAISIALCCLPFSAAAATISDGGECGEIKWSVEYDSFLMDYLLTISPINETAAMPDFESYGDNVSPWDDYSYKISAVKIEDGITRIGNYAFYWFSDIRYISNDSYYYYVKIPDSVTSIGDYAFASCRQLYSAEFGDTVKNIGKGVFSGCSGLSSVCLPTNLYAADGVSAGEIPDSLFSGCSNLGKVSMQQNKGVNFVLSGNINRIGKYAFSGCSKLKATNGNWLHIPITVLSIDDYAFKSCSAIDRISITLATVNISGSAFNGCTALKYLRIINLGWSDRFYMPSDSELYNKSETELVRIMPACSGTEYTVPDTTEKIGDCAFNSCTFEKITLGANVSEIGSDVFENCDFLLNIEVSAANKNYKSIDGVLYSKDGKTLIAYPGGRNNKSLKIPEGVKAIGSDALSNGTVTEVYFPSSVTEIPFLSYGIKNIYYGGTEAEFNSIENINLKIPYGATVICNAKPNEKCDINCDNKINVLDIISIKKSISANETQTYQSDINSDGKLNAEDIAALKLKLLTS